jgi:hypothetical protein
MREPVRERGVAFRVRSSDPEVPLRLMADRALVPGLRRPVDEHAAIVYVQALEPALTHMPRIYEFIAQFDSYKAVAVLAGRVWSALRGTDAVLEVQRVGVPLRTAAITEALLGARGAPPGPPGEK